jgi:hypothetical protein
VQGYLFNATFLKAASFFWAQNPVKHIQDAAMQGKSDDLSGTLASICWGKLAPVGTGANFEMLWRDLGM